MLVSDTLLFPLSIFIPRAKWIISLITCNGCFVEWTISMERYKLLSKCNKHIRRLAVPKTLKFGALSFNKNGRCLLPQ